VREKGEIISLGEKCIPVNPVMPGFKEIGKHLPVAPELRMHIANVIVLVAVESVVVVVAALIGTEFLIRPPKEPGSAVKTYSFHSSNVFIKLKHFPGTDNQKSPYHFDYYSLTRLQTDISDS
jgi:hypothetical protein